MAKSVLTNSAVTVGTVPLDLHGMLAGTDVLTADGALAVEHLAAGDKIVTRSGLRTLRSVSVRVATRAVLVRIATDTLGIGRPQSEMLLPAGQTVMIRDWRAQAMFGTAYALVAALRLADGQLIRTEARNKVRLFTLHFDAPEVVYAGGLELGCASQMVSA